MRAITITTILLLIVVAIAVLLTKTNYQSPSPVVVTVSPVNLSDDKSTGGTPITVDMAQNNTMPESEIETLDFSDDSIEESSADGNETDNSNLEGLNEDGTFDQSLLTSGSHKHYGADELREMWAEDED